MLWRPSRAALLGRSALNGRANAIWCVMSSWMRARAQDAATANANMCQLLEEEAAEKEREAREAAKRIKRKLKKAAARLRREEEEAESSATEAAAAPSEPLAADDEAAPVAAVSEDAAQVRPGRRLPLPHVALSRGITHAIHVLMVSWHSVICDGTPRPRKVRRMERQMRSMARGRMPTARPGARVRRKGPQTRG
jgi:flagellar biosynthesis GTPase FlhF